MITEIVKTLFGSDEAFHCIFCERFLPYKKQALGNDDIGICYDCMKQLEQIENKQSFPGTQHTNYLLAPYFYKSPLRSAIHRFKFRGASAYGNIFGKLIADYLNHLSPTKHYDMLVPIPLSQNRLLERGYNQSEIMARIVCENCGIALNTNAVARIKNTNRQSELRGMERYMNVKGAFSADSQIAAGKNIIVLDDIITTGNTIDACAKALLDAGAKEVIGLSLAYVYQDKEEINFM